jgi:hypothetical protein
MMDKLSNSLVHQRQINTTARTVTIKGAAAFLAEAALF